MNCRRIIFALLFAAVGCQEDQIRTLRVPKPQPVRLRILGAIVERPGEVWFFKLNGPASNVAADEEKFRGFLDSISFANDPPVNYATPGGWKVDTGGGKSRGGMVKRYSTLRTPNGNEAIITILDAGSGSLLDNINRWRKEVSLPPIEEKELPICTKEVTIGGTKGVWTDLVGNDQKHEASRDQPKAIVETPTIDISKSTIPPVVNHPTAAPNKAGVKFDVPSGWTVAPGQSSMRAVTFRMGEGTETAECYVTPLMGPSGGIVNNVNLWRKDMNLEELDEASLNKTLKEITVEGRPCAYADLLAPSGPKRQRTLNVIVPHGSTMWFVRMRGPAETVARHQAAFESFVRSLKLPAGG